MRKRAQKPCDPKGNVMSRTQLLFTAVSLLAATSTSDAFSFAPGPVQTCMSKGRSCKGRLSAQRNDSFAEKIDHGLLGRMAAAALSVAILTTSTPAIADGQTKDFKLPPIDFSDKQRCVLNSSKMGQANAARDKLYDLRMCNLSGKEAVGFDLSGVIMTKTDLSNSNLKEAQFSKGYLHDSNFDGADFSNAIVDRASFKGSSLKGTLFVNTVLTGTSFEGADVENADFTDAYIGDYDIKNLCKNPTLKGENPVTGEETRVSAGCR